MFRIIEERGTGKTRRLIEEAYKNNGVILCLNPDRMKEKAMAYKIPFINFASYDNLIYYATNINKRPIYIDELEIFLSRYNIAGYDMSIED